MTLAIPRHSSRTVSFFVPVKTKNPLNQRRHWRAVAAADAIEKDLTLIHAPKGSAIKLPCVVVMTRLSSGKLDSHDGLPGCLKHVADGVAEWAGVDDGDERIQFRYEQEKCRRGEEGVRVCVIQGARVIESLALVEDA